MTTQSEYTAAELAEPVTVRLTLGQLLALHGMASRQHRRETTRAAKRPYTPAPGKHNASAEAVGRLSLLVDALTAALDEADDRLENRLETGAPA